MESQLYSDIVTLPDEFEEKEQEIERLYRELIRGLPMRRVPTTFSTPSTTTLDYKAIISSTKEEVILLTGAYIGLFFSDLDLTNTFFLW